MAEGELPLFPLNTVLFPGGPLPLRVFEPRYLDMVGRCLKDDSGFGVLLIREGAEVGSAETFEVGTVAEIVDWHQGRDGLLGITAQDKQRFRLESTGRQPDGLYVGNIIPMDADPRVDVPEEYAFLARLLKEVLDQSGGAYQDTPKHYGDAAWVGYRLTEILPLPLEIKQSSLELVDPLARLDLLTSCIREEGE